MCDVIVSRIHKPAPSAAARRHLRICLSFSPYVFHFPLPVSIAPSAGLLFGSALCSISTRVHVSLPKTYVVAPQQSKADLKQVQSIWVVHLEHRIRL